MARKVSLKLRTLKVLTIPGICGQAKDQDVIVQGLGCEALPLDYDDSVERGVDAAVVRGMSVLHDAVDLFSTESHSKYIIVGHSAGGCILHRLLDVLLGSEQPPSGLPSQFKGRALAWPLAVVAIEPSMLLSDVGGHDGWASKFAQSQEPPEEEKWIPDVLKTTHWTWKMCRGLSAGLVEWCKEGSPQVDIVKRYVLKGGKYIYVCGELSAARNVKAKQALDSLGMSNLSLHFHEIPGAGHKVHKDQPKALVRVVKQSLLAASPCAFPKTMKAMKVMKAMKDAKPRSMKRVVKASKGMKTKKGTKVMKVVRK